MAEEPKSPKTAYTQEDVDKIVNDLKKRFARVVPEQSADYERISVESQTTIRDNKNMSNTLDAVGKSTSNANDLVVWTFSTLHTAFGTVDNYMENYMTPKRNVPLIILGVIALVGGTVLATNWQGFNAWYSSGYDWAVFWAGIVGVILGYRFYRNRQKKSIQTSPI